MKSFRKELWFNVPKRRGLVNITRDVQAAIDEAKAEGAKYKNVIYTNALGPVFVKNPWYAQHIIINALKNKNEEVSHILGDKDFELELDSLREIKKFIEQKEVKNVSGN